MAWQRIFEQFASGVQVRAGLERKTIVRYNKVNVIDFEVCHPKAVLRERPLGRTDRLDLIHVQEDGSVKHTPIE